MKITLLISIKNGSKFDNSSSFISSKKLGIKYPFNYYKRNELIEF